MIGGLAPVGNRDVQALVCPNPHANRPLYHQRTALDNVKNFMSLSAEKIGDVLVVLPSGQINSANAAGIEADLMAHVEKGQNKIILDLARLDYISSAGLRVVLMLAKRLKQAGGALLLCNIQPDVREVFDISGFLAILPVHDTRESALNSLA